MFKKIMPEKKIPPHYFQCREAGPARYTLVEYLEHFTGERAVIFFYLFGAAELKNFIVKDNKEPMNKVLKKRGKRTGQTRN